MRPRRRTLNPRTNRVRGWAAFFVLASSEWRTRWRSHLLVAIVWSATAAVVMATFTGAARSESAFHRLRSATRASDALVYYPDAQAHPVRATAAVDGLRGVGRASAEAEIFVRPAGTDYFPDYDLYSVAPLVPHESEPVDAPVLTSGRAVDVRRADEIAISQKLAAAMGVKLGERITLESMTTGWVDAANNGGDPGPPDGPRVPVRVVGLARSPADFGRWKGLLYLSPAFVARYGARMEVRAGVAAQLSDKALIDAHRGRLAGLDAGVEVGPSPFGDDAATDDGLGTIATALRLVAAAAALAGIVAGALALLRVAGLALGDRPTLVALGWTKPQLVVAIVVTAAPWLLAGVGVGLVAGPFTSPLALVGLARRIDPTPHSVVLDRGVVLAVLLGAVAVGVCLLVLAGQRAATARAKRAQPPYRSVALRRPLTAVLGVRRALFGDATGGSRTSRGALVVMSAGVVAIIAALTVSASIARLQNDPGLTGQGTGRVIDSGESVEAYDRALPMLARDRRVGMLAGVHISFSISAVGAAGRSAVGAGDLTTLAYDLRRGDLGVSILKGRMARGLDEVALGPATLERLAKRVGDRIELRGDRGRGTYRIVGSLLFPEGDFDYDDGVALTTSAADRLLGNAHDGAQLHQVVFDWTEGTDARAADKQLAARGLEVLTNDRALKPPAVNNLGQVEALPRYLALFLGLLCLVTLGHALVVSVRMRARELATLRALGMTARATTATVALHAFITVVLALAVGLPLGLRAGDRVWAPIADRAHVVVQTVVPLRLVLSTFAVAIAVAMIITALPAWRAQGLRPADTLRAE